MELDRLSFLEREWKQKEYYRDKEQRHAQNRYSAMEKKLTELLNNLHTQQESLNIKELKVRKSGRIYYLW